MIVYLTHFFKKNHQTKIRLIHKQYIVNKKDVLKSDCTNLEIFPSVYDFRKVLSSDLCLIVNSFSLVNFRDSLLAYTLPLLPS